MNDNDDDIVRQPDQPRFDRLLANDFTNNDNNELLDPELQLVLQMSLQEYEKDRATEEIVERLKMENRLKEEQERKQLEQALKENAAIQEQLKHERRERLKPVFVWLSRVLRLDPKYTDIKLELELYVETRRDITLETFEYLLANGINRNLQSILEDIVQPYEIDE